MTTEIDSIKNIRTLVLISVTEFLNYLISLIQQSMSKIFFLIKTNNERKERCVGVGEKRKRKTEK